VLAGGWLADRLTVLTRAGRFYVVGCGVAFSAPCAYLSLAASTVKQFRFYAVAFGLLAEFAMGNFFAAAYDAIADRNYGFATGVLNMTGGLSGGGRRCWSTCTRANLAPQDS